MKRIPRYIITLAFLVNTLGPVSWAQADEFRLPAPGVMVNLSPEFNPAILKGIKIHPDNPFRFDFILDKGDSQASNSQLKDESARLIKYFLASLTIPEKDLWVNLSPYEKDRIVPKSFGLTEMGRDLLAEDYMLKQITASLIYPEGETGKKFWKKVYEEAARKFGTTNIPVNTFNKVWIVPEKAVVYENAKAGTAYVVESKLKVMLEQDYLSMSKHALITDDTGSIGANIIRAIVIPELTREVNEDKNFSQLRQVYNSLILATWYKNKIRESILAQVYSDKNKIAGILSSPNSPTGNPENIYRRYLQAFKKGAFNYIKEESDPVTRETVPRKYFSGGVDFAMGSTTMNGINGLIQITRVFRETFNVMISGRLTEVEGDFQPSDVSLPLSAVNVPQGYRLIGGENDLPLAARLQKTMGLPSALLDPAVYSPFQDNRLTLKFMDTISSYIKNLEPGTLENKVLRVLEIGSGTGLGAMTAFHQAKLRGFQVKVDAVDINDESVENTRKNFELLRNEITGDDSVHVFKVPGDGLLNDLRGQYDLVLFYAPDALPKEKLNGINTAVQMDQDVFKRILESIADRLLTPKGAAIIGVQKDALKTLIPENLEWSYTGNEEGVYLGGQRYTRGFYKLSFKDQAMNAVEAPATLSVKAIPSNEINEFVNTASQWRGAQINWTAAIKDISKSRAFGIWQDKEFVGLMVIRTPRLVLVDIQKKMVKSLIIEGIEVRKDYQQRGIGKLLVAKAAELSLEDSETQGRVSLELARVDGEGFDKNDRDFYRHLRFSSVIDNDGEESHFMYLAPDAARLLVDSAQSASNIELKDANLNAANAHLTNSQMQEIVHAYLTAKGENPLPAGQLDVTYLGQGAYNIVLGYGHSAFRINKNRGGNLSHDRYYFTLLKHLGIGPGVLSYETLTINGKSHNVLEVERINEGSREKQQEVLNDQEIIQIEKMLDILIENRIFIEDFKLENVALENGKAYVVDVDTAKEYSRPFEPRGKELAEEYVSIIHSAKDRNWTQWTSYDPQGKIIKYLQDKAMIAEGVEDAIAITKQGRNALLTYDNDVEMGLIKGSLEKQEQVENINFKIITTQEDLSGIIFKDWEDKKERIIILAPRDLPIAPNIVSGLANFIGLPDFIGSIRKVADLFKEYKASFEDFDSTRTKLPREKGAIRMFGMFLQDEARERSPRHWDVVFMDIDNFGVVNKYFGQVKGDEILSKFAEVFKKKKRGRDILARLGGEEFGLVMPFANMSDNRRSVLERILSSVSNEVYLDNRDGILTNDLIDFYNSSTNQEEKNKEYEMLLLQLAKQNSVSVDVLRNDLPDFNTAIDAAKGLKMTPAGMPYKFDKWAITVSAGSLEVDVEDGNALKKFINNEEAVNNLFQFFKHSANKLEKEAKNKGRDRTEYGKFEIKNDSAMAVTNGGIDLTPARMNLQTRADSSSGARNDIWFRFRFDPAMLAKLQNAPGFVPVIIKIHPMNDLRSFLGIVNQTQ